MIYKSFFQSWFRTREIFPMVPMAQRVASSLPPQLVKGFLDKCFFSFCWKYKYTEIDFCWKYWNAKWKCTNSDSISACSPSQLPAQLPSRSLGRCRTYVLQSARKSTFRFQNTRKCHSKSHLFLSKQMSTYHQSKAGGDWGSQTEAQTSGPSSSQSETRKFIKKKVLHFSMNPQNSRRPSSFCGIRGRFVVFLLKGTGRPHQPGWVHRCASASSSGLTGTVALQCTHCTVQRLPDLFKRSALLWR